MAEVFDVAVIGGGPAGTSAAISAARAGHRVLLLERGTFPRDKVCGEFVSAESLALLQDLLGVSFSAREYPKISTARIFIDGKVRSFMVEPSAISLTRFELDNSLWQAAQDAGVMNIHRAAVTGISGKGPYHIPTADANYQARAVFNASGRWSRIGQDLYPSSEGKLGVKAHYHEKSPPSSVDLYFFHGGYCGVQPIGEDMINVSALVAPERAMTLADVFRLHPVLQERSENWTLNTQPVSTYPLVFKEPTPIDCESNIFNVGDAAGFIDPFVGDGISMALHSGKLAADCANDFLNGTFTLKAAALGYRNEYDRRLRPAFRNATRMRNMIATPGLRSVAMGLAKIPAVSRIALRSTRARSA